MLYCNEAVATASALFSIKGEFCSKAVTPPSHGLPWVTCQVCKQVSKSDAALKPHCTRYAKEHYRQNPHGFGRDDVTLRMEALNHKWCEEGLRCQELKLARNSNSDSHSRAARLKRDKEIRVTLSSSALTFLQHMLSERGDTSARSAFKVSSTMLQCCRVHHRPKWPTTSSLTTETHPSTNTSPIQILRRLGLSCQVAEENRLLTTAVS